MPMLAARELPSRTLTTHPVDEGSFRTTCMTRSAKVQVYWSRGEGSFYEAEQKAAAVLPPREYPRTICTEVRYHGRWKMVAGNDCPS